MAGAGFLPSVSPAVGTGRGGSEVATQLGSSAPVPLTEFTMHRASLSGPGRQGLCRILHPFSLLLVL